MNKNPPIANYFPKALEADTQTNLRLFCFPFAGAGASIYSNWHRYLPKNFEVCPIQLPGREERLSEKPIVDIMSMVAELGEILKPYLAQPFALFGHSMGALICFELTRHLRKLKLPMPESLFISGRPAPQLQQTKPLTYNLPDLEFIEELRKIQGTPEPVLQNNELMELLIPLLRADFELCQTYQYIHEPPLNCPFFIFGGFADSYVSQESLVYWQDQTTYPIQLKMFEGDHFFITNNQLSLLQTISKYLMKTIKIDMQII
jgi:medium-chain acyl-[acyl-carrier-protein] hydrolase